MLKFAFVFSALFMTTACATVDTGVIDYRRAEIPTGVTSILGTYPSSRCQPQTGSSTQRAAECAPLLGARLFRKNISRQVGIQPDEIYSIRLDYGFIDFVNEIPLTPGNAFSLRNPLRANAEIVVLARAFEFSAVANSSAGTDNTTNENGFLDLTTPSLDAARVIYYSPDIENGQSLNLSNIPIVGPSRYGGRPIGVQIIVLELDRVSPEMRGLLSNLASLGQTAGALPTGPAVEILTQLGSSLLAANQDDIVFEYRFVLDRSNQANEWRYPSFEEGRYVLRRLHYRDHEHVWRNLMLDHNTGQLFIPSGDTSTLYRDETYFTLNIINHGRGAAEAAYAHRSLSQLREAIEQGATAEDAALTQLSTNITNLTRNVRGNGLVRDLTAQWEAVIADAARVGENTRPLPSAIDTTVCRAVDRPERDLYVAQFGLAQSLAKFQSDWASAVAAHAANTATFGDEERLRVAANVGGFFAGLSDRVVSPATRLPASTFATVPPFQALIDSTLDASVDVYAKAMAPTDCASSVAAGFAEWVPPPAGR